MNLAALAGELQSLLQGSVRVQELMKNHTTWHIGGPADIFIDPAGKEDVKLSVQYARDKGIPLTIIGNGSNLLVKDGGIRGIVIKIGRGLAGFTVMENVIKAGAGAMLPELAATARRAGLGGFEFAAGIPGSLGGAVVMNAGAVNGCVADVLESVLVLNEQNDFVTLAKSDLAFSYRSSILQRKQYICLESTWRGLPKDNAVIEQETRDYLAKRKAMQPQGWPNAGSVFKNPPGDSAGRLIEKSQCKGLRVGDAEVSQKHANWILNLGQATAADVLSLIAQVQHRVQEKFGVSLHMEVRVLGED